MMKYIDSLPFSTLIMMAVLLAIVPYPMQEMPHSLEKLQMLFMGQLTKPLDIFDLFMHTGLLLVLLIKSIRLLLKKNMLRNID
ncbi:MAG: RND transporter [Pseudomonadota bacterium]